MDGTEAVVSQLRVADNERGKDNACNCDNAQRDHTAHPLTCPVFTGFYGDSKLARAILLSHCNRQLWLPPLGQWQSHELMRCHCGWWFPRWTTKRCPNCSVSLESSLDSQAEAAVS